MVAACAARGRGAESCSVQGRGAALLAGWQSRRTLALPTCNQARQVLVLVAVAVESVRARLPPAPRAGRGQQCCTLLAHSRAAAAWRGPAKPLHGAAAAAIAHRWKAALLRKESSRNSRMPAGWGANGANNATVCPWCGWVGAGPSGGRQPPAPSKAAAAGTQGQQHALPMVEVTPPSWRSSDVWSVCGQRGRRQRVGKEAAGQRPLPAPTLPAATAAAAAAGAQQCSPAGWRGSAC